MIDEGDTIEDKEDNDAGPDLSFGSIDSHGEQLQFEFAFMS